jgi:peptidoglycan/LPS O-acetylase OafA/YrhL
MVRSTDSPSKHEYVPALDGIRGFGFLGIFLAHYLSLAVYRYRGHPWVNGLFYIEQIALMVVPAFFVLSGYLIGGILFNSRNREGFFRVFYGRRILRILPVYYVTLLVVAGVNLAQGVHLNRVFWAHFFYIQNWLPGYPSTDTGMSTQIIHLWSLAIEEQFYLTWPIVVWFARDRAKLLKIIAVLSGLCFTVRLISPWIHLSPMRSYFATPTRVDAILLGVGLALVADHKIFKRLQPLAKYAVLVGTALWLISFSTHPNDPNNYYRVAVEIPLANFTVLALVAAVIDENSALAKACRVRWACWLGTMSYGLYVYHYTYHKWFSDTFRPQLSQYMPDPWAYLATAVIALALTIGLGMFSYRFIEQPVLSLKRYLKLGPVLVAKPIEKNAAVRGLATNRS